jgi:hypothetical protein
MGRRGALDAARQTDRTSAPISIAAFSASRSFRKRDVAHGKEGLNLAIFIGYPWEL